MVHILWTSRRHMSISINILNTTVVLAGGTIVSTMCEIWSHYKTNSSLSPFLRQVVIKGIQLYAHGSSPIVAFGIFSRNKTDTKVIDSTREQTVQSTVENLFEVIVPAGTAQANTEIKLQVSTLFMTCGVNMTSPNSQNGPSQFVYTYVRTVTVSEACISNHALHASYLVVTLCISQRYHYNTNYVVPMLFLRAILHNLEVRIEML